MWVKIIGHNVNQFVITQFKEINASSKEEAKKMVGELNPQEVFASYKTNYPVTIVGCEVFQEVNGTFYEENMRKELIDVLEKFRLSQRKVKLKFGDVNTGKDYHEENNTIGLIGRSQGPLKVPLLMTGKKKYGSSLGDSVVKVIDWKTKEVLYQHPTYHTSVFTKKFLPNQDLKWQVDKDGEICALFHSENEADKYIELVN